MGEEEEGESPRGNDDDGPPSSRPGEGSGVGLARLKEARRAEPERGGKRPRLARSEREDYENDSAGDKWYKLG